MDKNSKRVPHNNVFARLTSGPMQVRRRKQSGENVTERAKEDSRLHLLENPLNQIINVKAPTFKPKETSIKLTEPCFHKKRSSMTGVEILQSLREQGKLKFAVMEPEEPPDLLEMNVVQRSAHWTEKKKQNIEEKKYQLQAKELEECSFKPKLNKHMRSQSFTSFRTQKPPTYAEINKHKAIFKQTLRKKFKPDSEFKNLIASTRKLALNT